MAWTTYWIPIAAVAVAMLATLWLPHRFPAWPWRAAGVVLGVALVVCEVSWWVKLLGQRPWQAATGLPFQLCDLTAWVAAAALFWRRDVLAELTWFWGVGGAIPALFLPIRGGGWPSWFYVEYYVLHGGLIVAALLFAGAYHLRLRRHSVRRAIAITSLLAIAMGIVDAFGNANYLYLRAVPAVAGPLLRFAVWPWYLPALVTVGVLAIVLLGWPLRERPVDQEHPSTYAGSSGVA